MKQLSVKELFDRDVRSYSVYANHRAIPHVMDGFKTSHRKVIYGTLKKSASIPETGVRVSQLAAGIGEVAAYHHGEGSLEGAIVGMAQDFAGSNNLNYLVPDGQFGSRLSNTPASSRYIFTKLSPSFRKLFKKEDDVILENLIEDGAEIEPKFYAPLLPNVLINGSSGMGTGFASNILQYSPLQLREYILAKLKGSAKLPTLIPWFRGFSGTVERTTAGQTIIKGKVERVNTTTLKITELPIGSFQDSYKMVLNQLEEDEYIKDWEDNSDTKQFSFTLTVPRTTGYAELPELEKKLKLVAKVTENFTVWLVNGKVKCFDTPEQLTDYFIVERLKLFEVRRLRLLDILREEFSELSERAKFILYFIANSANLTKLARAELEAKLVAEGFTRAADHVELKLYTLTADHVEKLNKKIIEVTAEITRLENETADSLYMSDLIALDLKKDLAV